MIGYEVLARAASHFNYQTNTLTLAAHLADMRPPNRGVPFVYDDRQPQVDGDVDGLRTSITIDTSSEGTLDFGAPFVIAHDLLRKYPARVAGDSLGGGGGGISLFSARAKRVTIGTTSERDVTISLTQTSAGAFADPRFGTNLGEGFLQRSSLYLDYHQALVVFGQASDEHRSHR